MTKRGTSCGGIISGKWYCWIFWCHLCFPHKIFSVSALLMDWFIFVEYFLCRLLIENLLSNLNVPTEAYSRNVACTLNLNIPTEAYSRNVACTLNLNVPNEAYSRNVACTLNLNVPTEAYSRNVACTLNLILFILFSVKSTTIFS